MRDEWHGAPPWLSLTAAAGLAIGVAMVATVIGTSIVLLVEVPGSGLASHAWRVLVEPRPAAWLTVTVGAVPLVHAFRPVTRRAIVGWLARRSLPSEVGSAAAAELRRIRIVRTIPTVLGLCVGLGTYSAHQLAVSIHGTDAATASSLYEATLPGRYPGILLAAAGYLVGVVVAEVSRRRPRAHPAGSGVSGARLEPRRTANYLTRPARFLPICVAGLVGALGITRAIVGSSTLVGVPRPTWPLIATVVGALIVGAPLAQAWLVRRPQRAATPADLALDDTFRSSAAHGVVAATLVAGLVTALDLLGDLWNVAIQQPVIVPWLSVGIGVALMVATGVVWLRYGTAHPGRRPPLTDGAS